MSKAIGGIHSRFLIPAIMLMIFLTAPRARATPLGTAFTYQGQLQNSGTPENGSCDLQFRLFDAASGGSQVGGTITDTAVAITNGLFTVTLDFGSGAFGGNARWLEIAVACPSGSGFTTLAPRQELTPSPNALFASTAIVATDSTLSGNGTPSSPLGVVAGSVSISHDATLTGNGTGGTPLGVAVPLSLSLNTAGVTGLFVVNSSNTNFTIGVKGVGGTGTGIAIGAPIGVVGDSASGIGVQGLSSTSTAVSGTSNSGYGVGGFSTQSIGVLGQGGTASNVGQTGVHGQGGNGSSGGYAGAGVAGIGGTGSGGTLDGFGISGTSGSGVGVNGFSTSGIGVQGLSSTNLGVVGLSTSSYGVEGFSSQGQGVFGQGGTNGSGFGQTGVYGQGGNGSTGFQPGPGVRGIGGTGSGGAQDGYGVWGSSGSSYGVSGDSSSAAGVIGSSSTGQGVTGSSASATFEGAGGYNSSSGPGIFGQSASGYGVWGHTSSGGGSVAGVYGLSNGSNGNGVIGEDNTGLAAYGVWGRSTSGYAGYFSGNVTVTGTLTSGVKDFRIDHPLDPANKYLVHASVESSEMKNIYDGIVTLDGAGEAVVELPAWFGAENRDFRYQLTCIGGFSPVWIEKEVEQNRFTIKGAKPGQRVSWLLTGIRQDRYARAHPLEVEPAKPEEERGYYIHPELWGEPEAKSLEHARGKVPGAGGNDQ